LNTALFYTGLLGEFNPLEPIASVPLFSIPIGPWQINVSNHMFMVALAAMLLLFGIPAAMRRNHNTAPRGMRSIIEAVCVFLKDEVAGPILKGRTDKYIGFIWTVFFFILTLNLLAMIPTEKIIALVTGKKNHFGGAATANIWITGAMAAVAFFMTHIIGIREQGLWRYIVNFVPPVPWWLAPLIYFLEIISSLIRPFTLAIRLFANIIAGHMILGTFLGLIIIFKSYGIAAASVLASVALSLLELMVAFIQAYIFAFLCTLYIGFAVEPEH
jgi:F-type H+-transporting ATPase subunit a